MRAKAPVVTTMLFKINDTRILWHKYESHVTGGNSHFVVQLSSGEDRITSVFVFFHVVRHRQNNSMQFILFISYSAKSEQAGRETLSAISRIKVKLLRHINA